MSILGSTFKPTLTANESPKTRRAKNGLILLLQCNLDEHSLYTLNDRHKIEENGRKTGGI